MRKLRVQHELLPGIDERFEFKAASGIIVVVVSQRSGRRDIGRRAPGDDDPLATVGLTQNEALAPATLLTGAQVELLIAAPV